MKIYIKILQGLFIGLISIAMGSSIAQEVTLDYLGEINDSEHPPGYREYVEMGCYQCHGFQGQGAVSPPLVARLMPYEGFANQVRRPRNTMPAYSQNILSDAKLRAIYRYLEQVPASPDPADIPLLSGD